MAKRYEFNSDSLRYQLYTRWVLVSIMCASACYFLCVYVRVECVIKYTVKGTRARRTERNNNNNETYIIIY